VESRLSALTGDGTTTIPEYTILYTIVYTILYTILYTIPYTILSVMKETSSHPYSHSLPFTPIHSHSFPFTFLSHAFTIGALSLSPCIITPYLVHMCAAVPRNRPNHASYHITDITGNTRIPEEYLPFTLHTSVLSPPTTTAISHSPFPSSRPLRNSIILLPRQLVT